MLSLGVKNIGKHFGLERSDSMVVGLVNSTFVRLYTGRSCKILLMSFQRITELDKVDMQNILSKYKIKKIKWDENVLSINFIEIIKPYSIKKIIEIINLISGYVFNKYPDEQMKCPSCNSVKEGELYSLKDNCFYLCKDCYSKTNLQLQDEKVTWAHLSNNYILGFFGALVFSIPGIIITALCFIFLERIAALSAILYVFLAIKGYSFLKGKVTKVGAVIVNSVGILMTCIGIYISYILNILYKTRSYEHILDIIKTDKAVREIQLNIIIALIISSFYLIYNTICMMKEWKFPELKRTRPI